MKSLAVIVAALALVGCDFTDHEYVRVLNECKARGGHVLKRDPNAEILRCYVIGTTYEQVIETYVRQHPKWVPADQLKN